MKKRITKISLFILIALIIVACNTTKRVPEGKRLLTKIDIIVNDKKNKDEDAAIQLYQKPNSSILGYRLRLNLYNMAKPKADSSYHAYLDKNQKTHKALTNLLSEKQVNRLGKSFAISGFNNFLMKTGEPPVIFDSISTKKSLKRLQYFYFNRGYFDVKSEYTTDTSNVKKLGLQYRVVLGQPYIIDSVKTEISTPALDSLYNLKRASSFIKTKQQYNTDNFNSERSRITTDFRNNGVYFFQPNYVTYDLDTIDTKKMANVKLLIKDQNIRINDTSKTQPFKIYKISKVNVFTDHSPSKNDYKINDSTTYKGFTLYSEKKLKYRPRAITDAIFIIPGTKYSDFRTSVTSRFLSNLRVFNSPTIQYSIDPKDDDFLVANIFLTPRKKYTFNAAVDFTHSNIQDFGISGNTSLSIRNVFNGAETFEIGFRGNIGSSRQLDNPNNNFFNISEFGIDAKLNFPRIFLPFNTDKIIPKTMIPYTTLSVGYAKQRNIGLDKQNFTSALTYNWTPRRGRTARFDLVNIQFVKNLNVQNYFSIYKSSYEALNNLALNYNANPVYFNDDYTQLLIDSGTNGFTNEALNGTLNPAPTEQDLKTIRSIEERRKRLTENNLIFATNFSFSTTTSTGINDNTFHTFRTKIESAGNLLSILARASKQLANQNGANTIFDVEFSQYIKTEFEYIKHWDLTRKKVIAVRTFFGIAIPYGNSNSIPFSRSYFSGGSNDNRGWQPYSLGPGSSGGINDFNEANMKISLNAEFRFNIAGKLNGGLFADVGNIWNVFDNVQNDASTFDSLDSLKDIALGTGFGLRYDFGIFVLRGDLGLKTYNPAKRENDRWFREINFAKSVINIGINYPF